MAKTRVLSDKQVRSRLFGKGIVEEAVENAVAKSAKVRQASKDSPVSTNGHKRGPGAPKRDPNETAADAFVRLAGARTYKALKMLKGIERCTNTDIYEYTEQQAEQIINMLEKAVKRIRRGFEQGGPTATSTKGNIFS